ncbi:MAG: hypothetical protein ACREQ4_00920 [Candidatus Binataceae bacterium]
MKRLKRLHWCGVVFFTALITPGLVYAGGNWSNAPASAGKSRGDSSAPLAVAPMRVVQESDLTSSDYEPEAIFPPSQAPTPDAQNLLPCPLSVPCRVESDNDQPAVVSHPDVAPQPGNVRMAEIPTPSGMQMKALLPCPMSVPCIAEPTPPSAPPPASPARHRMRRQTRPHEAVKAVRVRHDAPVRSVTKTRVTKSVRPMILPPPEVTLQGSSVLKLQAEHSLEQIDARLAMLNPVDLVGEQAVTYEQAHRLLAAGHSALVGQDYLTALGLCSKASRLISMLPGYAAKREAQAH